MPVFLLQTGGDATTLDEIERRLTPAIPDLKRIGGIEDIGKHSLKAAGRMLPHPGRALGGAGLRQADRSGGEPEERVLRRPRRRPIRQALQAIDLLGKRRLGGGDGLAAGNPQHLRPRRARGRARRSSRSSSRSCRAPGASECSTLAIETSIQLIRRRAAKDGKLGKLALIDLDFQTSHVCDYLDVAPKFRIEEITRGDRSPGRSAARRLRQPAFERVGDLRRPAQPAGDP